MRKSDFTLPTLDDLFSTQAERDDASVQTVRREHPYPFQAR